jgi:uncharacterized membrane protein YedE/YeeE
MSSSAPAAVAPAQRHSPPEAAPSRAPGLAAYFAVGLFFGILLVKAEVISWFRIQEMFRFQAFHMFGIFATALPVAIISVQLIKRRGARTISGETVTIPPKTMGSGTRYIAGGIIFGLGWALTGACPRPLFALLGSSIGVMAVAIISAMAGTWTYSYLRPKLPH